MYFADEIRTIDFEYAGMNYFPYDIGNHFCEYAGKIVVLHMHTVQTLQTSYILVFPPNLSLA